MPAAKKILDLVKLFQRNADEYKDPTFKEANLRVQFIDPMFKELGWDMANEQGHAEAYKEVIHEAALKIGEENKAPDYCFRIGGTPKFYLEAKKPAVNIKDDPSPAYQLRRYAWSAKFPLSILTDFEEFAIYDGRVKPSQTDKASAARIVYMRCDEYADKWNEIADVFAREAILRGSFDKYADSKKGKRGTATVDAAFLEEIEGWREELAKNFALRNPKLSSRELNYAVQITIDRIIFLRMCEDRGIEPYGQLRDLTDVKDIYGGLFSLFRQADDRYNSGLFHLTKEKDRPDGLDTLTPNLKLDDKVLKTLLGGLYYPKSPYVFSKIPTEILGQVYEQFLGKVIRLTGGHQAKVEEKPEVKKAGGVYYTPTYIVDYIVKHTVGKLLGSLPLSASERGPGGEVLAAASADLSPQPPPRSGEGEPIRLTPKQASKLKILDPACGSGSFLLGAYQYLLDWYLAQYRLADPEKLDEELFKDEHGEWHLTTQEKKRILLDNIFGVDIDAQAVEVTKLSLLLKVLEGETKETINQQRRLFHGDRVLPDLANNIKCGNSLIGPDFYDEPTQGELFDDEEERIRINVFDWNAGFPAIMKAGGFDAVIGNPPYIFTRELLTEFERRYFASRFRLSWEKHNTFMLFMELMTKLLGKGARGGFIVPNSWLTIESAHLLREQFVAKIRVLADLNYAVFDRVSMEPSVFVIGAERDPEPLVMVVRATSEVEFSEERYTEVPRASWAVPPAFRFVFSSSGPAEAVVGKVVNASDAVGDRFDVRTGLQAYEKGKGNPPQSAEDVAEHVFDRDEHEDANSHRYLEGKDVERYGLSWSGMWMQYGPWLSQPREIGIFRRPRVLVREITGKLPHCIYSTYVDDDYLNNKSILNVLHKNDDVLSLKTLACILSCKLLSLFYKHRAVKSSRLIFPKIVIKNLREFPFPKSIPPTRSKRFVELADRMLLFRERLKHLNSPPEKSSLQAQIAATDRQIDALVYELYGLSHAEIKIVEGAAGA